jgi:hypothetical protein
VRGIPAADKEVAQLATLVVANQCAQRADRIALLMLLAAQFPRFVHNNPPGATATATVVPLAPEAAQFFRTGQPEVADRYFPWLVNLMSPVYWVYLVMAVTVLLNVLKGLSRFRLWRIDSAREKLETALKKIVDRGPTHAQMRSTPAESMVAAPGQRAVARSIMEQLTALRLRCQRQVASIVTPMGDEMFYRYQQALIDEAITTVNAILAPNAATGPTEVKN